MNRNESLKSIKSQTKDLVIIGGGINGAGIARDAAMRGFSVSLLEAKDFASGTSSKSSKLIHGGIRYLENLEFHLVFEALSERAKLFNMAPHLVHPLRFMIPLYKHSRVGMFKMGLGMWLYDALSLFKAPKLHERLGRKKTLEKMPILKAKELSGSYIYSDAYMDDDRLVHETLRSATSYGAHCANYVKIQKIERSNGNYRLQCYDEIDKHIFFIEAKKVISTVGAWTDELGFKISTNWKSQLRPTKGIHLTLSKDRLPLTSAVVMAAEGSDRIVFGIPRHEMVIIGTTDTDYKDSPDNVQTDAEDVRYLLSVVHSYFPNADLSPADFIASYAGVRPLVKDDAQTEGKTSREHSIWVDSTTGVVFVAGGKYTTYRLIAEEAVNQLFPHSKKAPTEQSLNSWTSPEAYNLALKNVLDLSKKFSLGSDLVLALAERYGQEAEIILKKFGHYKNLWAIEAAQAIETTMCIRIIDFYCRRVPLFLADQNHGLDSLNEIARVFKDLLKLSDDDIDKQKQELFNFINKELQWKKVLT